MAEQLRTREQINQDYGNTCAQIGERVFQISVMEQDVEALKRRILSIGEEMKALEQVAKQSAPVAEEVPSEAAQQ